VQLLQLQSSHRDVREQLDKAAAKQGVTAESLKEKETQLAELQQAIAAKSVLRSFSRSPTLTVVTGRKSWKNWLPRPPRQPRRANQQSPTWKSSWRQLPP